jgi:hypothetical protein
MAYSLLFVKNLKLLDSFNPFRLGPVIDLSAHSLNWLIQVNGLEETTGWANRGRMMKAEIGLGRLPGGNVSLYEI